MPLNGRSAPHIVNVEHTPTLLIAQSVQNVPTTATHRMSTSSIMRHDLPTLLNASVANGRAIFNASPTLCPSR